MASTLDTERRVLIVLTGFTVLGILFLLISLGTDYWVILEIPNAVYRNSSQAFVTGHHSGLWRICRSEYSNITEIPTKREYCAWLKLFPSTEEVARDPEIDMYILNYSRTETSFAVIALILMGIGHIFAFYSLKEPRYMFKRIVALMHLMTAVCVLVSAEVMVSSVNYERQYLNRRHPKGSYYAYGYSFYLMWFVFAFYVVASIAFLVCSRKRKGEKAGSESAAIENEPVHLGRV